MRQRLYARYVSTQVTPGASGPQLTLERHVLPFLPTDRSARILDIGCGAGDLLARLQGLGYTQAVGVDVSAEQVIRAAERGVVGVHERDLRTALAEENGSLDAVVALDVLEHFDAVEVLGLLDDAVRALRPDGGVLIARVPNAVSPFFGRYRYGDLTHGVSFTSRSLRQALRLSGFSTARFVPVNPLVHSPVSLLRWMAWSLIAAGLKAALAAETGQLRGHVVTQNMMVHATRADVPGNCSEAPSPP